jgi:hypothetical protein
MTSTPPNPWQILDLAATTDVAEIRKAYARRLKAIDTSRDLEAFQKLRWAYESASRLAADAVRSAHAGDSGDADPAPEPTPAPRVDRGADALADPESGTAAPSEDPAMARDPLVVRATTELPSLAEPEQRRWLEREFGALSLDRHAALELELLGCGIDDLDALLPCLPTLIDYFQWNEPAQVACRRDHGIVVLHQQLRLHAAYTAVVPLLQRLCDIAPLSAQWAALDEHFAVEANRLPYIDFAVLDALVRGRPRFVRSAWVAILFFRFRPSDEVQGRYGEMLAELFRGDGEVWREIVAAGTDDLLAALAQEDELVAQRRVLAQDPRLKDPQWRVDLEHSLRQRCDAQPRLPGSEALRLHFDPVPGGDAPHGVFRPQSLRSTATRSDRAPIWLIWPLLYLLIHLLGSTMK